MNEAYIQGFMAKCAEDGLTEKEATSQLARVLAKLTGQTDEKIAKMITELSQQRGQAVASGNKDAVRNIGKRIEKLEGMKEAEFDKEAQMLHRLGALTSKLIGRGASALGGRMAGAGGGAGTALISPGQAGANLGWLGRQGQKLQRFGQGMTGKADDMTNYLNQLKTSVVPAGSNINPLGGDAAKFMRNMGLGTLGVGAVGAGGAYNMMSGPGAAAGQQPQMSQQQMQEMIMADYMDQLRRANEQAALYKLYN